MELTFSWETKDQQVHDCDDCHKEKVGQAMEEASDGSEERSRWCFR